MVLRFTLKIAIAYVFLCCQVGGQQISDKDVIDIEIEAYADFSNNMLHFRLLSDRMSILIELPGCSLDLDYNLNNEQNCIYFTRVSQSVWFKAVGRSKPNKIQGVKIKNFAKTKEIIEKKNDLGIRLFIYTIENNGEKNVIQGPLVLKKSVTLRKLRENDLDDTVFHIIPLE